MEQRDILKDQIEQLGQVIGKAIAIFFGWKERSMPLEGVETANEFFKTKIDLDINKLVHLSAEENKNYFLQRLYTAEQLELIAQYAVEVGQVKLEFDSAMALRYFQLALTLFQIAGFKSKVYSLDRNQKEQKLQAIIDRLR